MTTNIKEAVQRGAALLDINRPGWASRIDVGILDLANAKNCILGQECQRFTVGKEKLKIHLGSEYGFSLPMRSHGENTRLLWKGLKELWIKEIVIRLLDEWAADESGYDEEAWPELKAALEGVRTEEMAVA